MKKSILIGTVFIGIIGIVTCTYAVTSNYGVNKNIEEKKEVIEQRVDEGIITEEEAEIIESKLENCDGTSQEKIGQEYGICFGQGKCGQQNYENKKAQNSEYCGQGICNGQNQGNGKGNCLKMCK